ncbi:MAG: YdcF family protein [Acidobacteria bacterium]|nr:YdcF family protein [Acidobacteriota bacterium]
MSRAVTAVATPGRKWIWRLLILGLLALAAFTAHISRRIGEESQRDETLPADAIVVFGAAEYAGRPSPVYRARLDHAYDLFQRGLAPMIITTGGAGGDPHFSEGGVGREYLVGRGVPEPRLIAETQGGDTQQSAGRVAVIMKANGMRTCLAVSDGYHMFRIKQMLGSQGVVVYGAPRPESRPLSPWERIRVTLREVLSYVLWRMGIS